MDLNEKKGYTQVEMLDAINIEEIKSLREENKHLREEIKKLKEALRPFAEQAMHMSKLYATETWMAKKADFVNAYKVLHK